MKTISVRLDQSQAAKLARLGEELHNSDAGVVRYALDLLFRSLTDKGDGETQAGDKEKEGS
jgi:Arc/MetJ-type ribon-helix-helix transcriptional regulator